MRALQERINVLEQENRSLKQRISKLEEEKKEEKDVIIHKRTAELSNEKEFKKRNTQNIPRVRAINDEVRQMSDPQSILNDFPRLFRITYIIFLWRYKNRPAPPPPKWEYPKVMYIGANVGETIQQIRDRAVRVIERHWELQNQNGVEVEIPFQHIQNNHADFQMANRYVQPHLSRWLRIQDQYIRDITNAPGFNDLIALGKSWKHSILETLNKQKFKLREGMCWVDYLEQKLCGQTGFKHFNRMTLESQLYNVCNKTSGFSNNDILKWIKHYNHAISLYCFDPNFEIKCKYRPPSNRGRTNLKILCYMLNNEHIHPIENDKLFKSLGCGHINSLFQSDLIDAKYKVNHRCNFKNFIKFDNSMNIDDLVKGKIGINNNVIKDVVYFSENQIKWTELIKDIINQTNYAPSVIRPYNKSFIHPLSCQLYQQTDDYDERLNIATILKNKFNFLNFEWQNQSITQLAQLIFEYKFGHIPKSSHTRLAIGLLDNYSTLPITCCVNSDTLKYKKHYDIKKAYASVVVDYIKNELLPMHTIMDNIEPFDINMDINNIKIGLYLIEEINHRSGLRIETQWISHFELKKYIDMKIIDLSQVKLQYLSKYYIKGSIISDFVEYLFENFDEKIANKLFHRFYGSFNIKKRRKNYAFITSDENMALCYNKEHLGQSDFLPIEFDTNKQPTKWLVERKINERIECDNVGLYTCILGGGRIKLIEMIDKLYNINPNFTLNAVRVDSIYVSSNDKSLFNKFENKYCKESNKEKYFEKLKEYPYRIESHWNPPNKKRLLRIDTINVNDYNLSPMKMQIFDENIDYSDKNILVQGFGGTRKTGVLYDYYNKHKTNGMKCKVIANTNVAVRNLVDRGVDNDDVMTIANFVGWTGSAYTRQTSNNFDLLSIDEYSMIDLNNWLRINKKLKISNAKLHAFGDKWQCCAVEGEIKYDITKTQFLKELLGKNGLLLHKTYKSTNNIEPRCDKYIRSIVLRMIDDPEHRLPVELFTSKYEWLWERHPTAISDTMVCKTNKMVDKLNNKLNDKIKIGCKVIINEINDKKLNVYNGERYVVKNIEGNKVYLEQWIADPTKRYRMKNKEKRIVPMHYLKLSNSATCYKYQGLTLYEPYIIFEPHLMNLQEFIVALTRAKKLSQIRITNKYQLQNKCFENVFESDRIAEINIESNLKKYNLYIIKERTSKRAYIGITSNDIDIRFEWHKNDDSNCKCKDFDWNNSDIELIGKYLATSLEDNEIEKAYIQDYNKYSEYNIVNYRENNYKIDLKSPKKQVGSKTTENIDLSNKFNVREGKDRYGNYFYIQEGKSQRKRRFGKTYTKAEARVSIEKVRKNLFKKYYPNTS